MITSLSKIIVLISFLHLTFMANRSNIHLGLPKILNGSSEYFTVIVIIFLVTFILTIFYQGDKQDTGLSTEYHITDAVRWLGAEGSGINQDIGFFFYWHIMLSQFLPYIKANQLYVYINPLPWGLSSSPAPLPPSHLSRSSQSTKLSSLGYTAASHQISILHKVLYICLCYCLDLPRLFLLPKFTSLFSTSTSLFLPCKQY